MMPIKNPKYFYREEALTILKTEHFSKKIFVSVYIK